MAWAAYCAPDAITAILPPATRDASCLRSIDLVAKIALAAQDSIGAVLAGPALDTALPGRVEALARSAGLARDTVCAVHRGRARVTTGRRYIRVRPADSIAPLAFRSII